MFKKIGNKVIFKGNCKGNNFKEKVREYFDLDTNYDKLKERLSKIDENLDIATKFGKRNQNIKSRFMGMYYIFYYFCK